MKETYRKNGFIWSASAGPDDAAQKALAAVRELRKSLGKEGVKAFVWQLEEITAD